ncbi:trehalase family glycosidase, partial [Pseudomonas aeruginosa]|uniref:trehalase family glycosidase n=1 Tax=Pseudomonas aeruginosa TaxID=287 RepID=UPI0038576CFA
GNQGGGGGGEYPLQDGFGWSNGVTLQLLRLYGPGAGRCCLLYAPGTGAGRRRRSQRGGRRSAPRPHAPPPP